MTLHGCYCCVVSAQLKIRVCVALRRANELKSIELSVIALSGKNTVDEVITGRVNRRALKIVVFFRLHKCLRLDASRIG